MTAVSWGHHISCLVFERQILLPELLKQQNEHNVLSSYCYALKLGLEVEKKNISLKFFLIRTAENQFLSFLKKCDFTELEGRGKKTSLLSQDHIYSFYHIIWYIFFYTLVLIINSFEEAREMSHLIEFIKKYLNI